MNNLLTTAAVMEVGAGLGLMALPSPLTTLLLGSPLDTPVASIVARVAGVALFALGVACWLSRHDGQSRAARGLVGAMVFYNAAIATVLVFAGVGLGLSSIGFWPTIVLHSVMTVWCISSLLKNHSPPGTRWWRTRKRTSSPSGSRPDRDAATGTRDQR